MADERHKAIELIAEAVSSGARRRKACELLGISLRTLERWEKPSGTVDKRQLANKPVANALSQEERQRVMDIANCSEYKDLPPSQIVPRLADNGLYIASESTFYRVLREASLQQHRQSSRPCRHHKPDEFVASAPNELWSWDITYCASQITGLFYFLYLMMDIFSRKIVGWSVHEEQSAEHASDLMLQACYDEQIEPGQIVLHSDNGGPMKGATMLATLQKLGVIPSFSRPSVSNDNPYSEALFRTLKYRPNYPTQKFENIDAVIEWTARFVSWYNHEHYHSALKFVTPQQRHTGEDKLILAKRKLVYRQSKQQHPERWSGNTRNWDLTDTVTLNPNKKKAGERIVNEQLLSVA